MYALESCVKSFTFSKSTGILLAKCTQRIIMQNVLHFILLDCYSDDNSYTVGHFIL